MNGGIFNKAKSSSAIRLQDNGMTGLTEKFVDDKWNALTGRDSVSPRGCQIFGERI